MPKLYAKFPPNKPITQRVMRDNDVGAVISAQTIKVFGGEWENQHSADFSAIDLQLQLAEGMDIHLSPVASRYVGRGGWGKKLIQGKISGQGMEIVDRYADRVTDWTLAHELILFDEVWPELVEFYQAVAAKYPGLRLWAADYAVRDEDSRNAILRRLRELKELVPQLYGFASIDYLDIDVAPTGTQLDKIVRYVKVNSGQTFPLRRFQYLNGWFYELQQIGLKSALETSVFSSVDTPDVRACQQQVFNCLARLCDRFDAQLWWWELVGESARYFHDNTRQVFTGLWDEGGEQRLDVAGILQEKTAPN